MQTNSYLMQTNSYNEWRMYVRTKGYHIENGGDNKLYAVSDGIEYGIWNPNYGGAGFGWVVG